MKLLQQTTRYYLAFSLVLFLVLGSVLFVLLRTILNQAVEEKLERGAEKLERQLTGGGVPPERMDLLGTLVEIAPLAQPTVIHHHGFHDTLIFDPHPEELEMEPYRSYTYDATIDGRSYRIRISESTVESDDLISAISGVFLLTLLLLLLSFVLLNRYLSRTLWQPFYHTMKRIGGFSVRSGKAPLLLDSATDEFNDLNATLRAMTAQLLREYDSLRRFTENASHEIQTPLAIIRGHLDGLLRAEERPEADYRSIQHISEAVTRLGRLNQSLLLLTKIENDQFTAAAWLDLAPLASEKLTQLAPALADKMIVLRTDLTATRLRLHSMLADVLLNNLLGNAVRHNLPGGELAVSLDGGNLTIANTGPPLTVAPETLFERFSRADGAGGTLGLGLAIVREICERHGYTIQYTEQAGRHRVVVDFGRAAGSSKKVSN